MLCLKGHAVESCIKLQSPMAKDHSTNSSDKPYGKHGFGVRYLHQNSIICLLYGVYSEKDTVF